MMKFKKFLVVAMTGAMMLGMVATTAPAVSAIAADETQQPTEPTIPTEPTVPTESENISGSAINYNKMTVTVKSNDPFIVVKYYKDETKKEGKPSNIYTYPTDTVKGSVTIDLGFYKPGKKEAYIRCYGSSDTEAVIFEEKLSSETGKLKLKIDTTKEDFLEALKAKQSTIESLEGYSYRSLYGTEWLPLKEFDYSTAKVAGTTIVVRKNATDTAPASAETKLKISGMSKAPTLKITYEKDTIGVDKVEYALVENAVKNDYKKSESKPVDFKTLKENLGITDPTKSFTIAVRTNKNEKVSMPSLYTFKPAPVLKASGAIASTTTSGSSITVTNTSEGNKNQVKLEVTNSNGNTDKYEYNVGKGWKAVNDKNITVSGDTISVRVAGIKAPKKDTDPEAAFPSEGVDLTIPKKEEKEEEKK